VASRGRGRVAASGEPALIAALPPAGTFVPGRSLAGVRLGEPAAEVRAQLGRDFGLCRGCARTTWYFTYRRFDDKGLAVELTRGRVSAVYTLWKPPGWHTKSGLSLGAPQANVPHAIPVTCSGYEAFVSGTSVYYVVGGTLWGFGLVQRGRSPCR
jgi:hypothetical protein